MRNYIDIKRKFLTDYFVFKKLIDRQTLPENNQDSGDKKQNKLYDKFTPWKILLDKSKDLTPQISLHTIDSVNFGLSFDNTISSDIYRAAINKILPYLMVEFDSDDQELILEKIVNYITTNNLHKKSFYNLIKNIKNLNIDLFPEE